MSDFERAVEFVHGITRRAASTEVPWRFGTAYLNLDVPNVWSRNYLLATENVTEASAEDLAAEADRIMGGAGLRHRKVELSDDAAGERLEPGFRALGWVSECDVIMVAKTGARPAGRHVDRGRSLSRRPRPCLDGRLENRPGGPWRRGHAPARREQAQDGRGRGHEVLRGPRGRGDRELLRALLRRADGADRERPHTRAGSESEAWPGQSSPRLWKRHGPAATS